MSISRKRPLQESHHLSRSQPIQCLPPPYKVKAVEGSDCQSSPLPMHNLREDRSTESLSLSGSDMHYELEEVSSCSPFSTPSRKSISWCDQIEESRFFLRCDAPRSLSSSFPSADVLMLPPPPPASPKKYPFFMARGSSSGTIANNKDYSSLNEYQRHLKLEINERLSKESLTADEEDERLFEMELQASFQF